MEGSLQSASHCNPSINVCLLLVCSCTWYIQLTQIHIHTCAHTLTSCCSLSCRCCSGVIEVGPVNERMASLIAFSSDDSLGPHRDFLFLPTTGFGSPEDGVSLMSPELPLISWDNIFAFFTATFISFCMSPSVHQKNFAKSKPNSPDQHKN